MNLSFRNISFLFLVVFGFFIQNVHAQSYRGMAVLNDSVVWLSGSKGTVVKTLNGGNTWDTISPKGYAKKDFRDIYVFDKSSAIIMSSGDSAVVLKTDNGGKTWYAVMENNRQGVFLDAMDFNKNRGVIIGDPYFDKDSNTYYFDYYESQDYGNNWKNIKRFKANKNDALYAASGTNILLNGLSIGTRLMPVFVTGGGEENYFISQVKTEKVPLQKGEGCGIYSLSRIENIYLAVGGSYLFPHKKDSVAAYREPKDGSWILSETQPGGYRSSVCVSKNKMAVCTGTNGIDLSIDGGKNWIPLMNEGFNSCAFSDNYLWLAGDKGKWLKTTIKELTKGK